MKKYKEYIITSDPFNPEILNSIMWELEITGTNEDVNCLRVFADMESKVNHERISEQLQKLKQEGLLRNFNVEESVIEEKNWNEEWEKSLNVIKVSDRLVIKPSFKDYNIESDEIVITIDPKMAFGTGEHQTTKLILRLLEKYIKPGTSVLDAGTGSGILSIAAVKLGAAKALAFDTDEWCYENALENCQLNNVSEQVEIKIGDINTVPREEYDIILANIQKNILMELPEEFSSRLKNRGIILLSGLLEGDEQDIVKMYSSKGFNHLETIQMDEWIALSLTKGN